MKGIKKILILLSLVVLSYSQTISQNIQFTDMDGKSWDLFSELDKGKYILCHFHFNN